VSDFSDSLAKNFGDCEDYFCQVTARHAKGTSLQVWKCILVVCVVCTDSHDDDAMMIMMCFFIEVWKDSVYC